MTKHSELRKIWLDQSLIIFNRANKKRVMPLKANRIRKMVAIYPRGKVANRLYKLENKKS